MEDYIYYNFKMEKENNGRISGCLLAGLVLYAISVFIPFNIKTRVGGEHTGYVTAVESNLSIIIPNNTTTVYIKTDLSSSQEDIYCIPTSLTGLVKSLKDAASNKSNVKIYFDGIMAAGIGNCDGDVITGVEVLDLSQTH